jgi:hypothetical protein
MVENTGEKTYEIVHKNRSTPLLTLAIRHTAQSRTTSYPAKLTTKALSQIPKGLSNFSEYLLRHETHEDIAMGKDTHHSEGLMAAKLAAWDANWKAVGGK